MGVTFMERERFLSDQEIINCIINYLNDQVYNYAVMIDGEWGTGKSFFVNKTLLPAVKTYEEQKSKISDGAFNPHKFIYLSLYGINETEEVSRLLFSELCKSFVQSTGHDASRILSWIGGGTRILADLIKNNSGVDLQKVAEGVTINSLLSDCVLIFDDLERVCCDINEVLGYINNLVEHEGLKILLITNEKEIDNRSRLINDPNKLTFCLNKKVNYGEFSRTISRDRISIKELEDRANYVFPGNRNYKHNKEKLVGITINYRPNYYELISTLTSNSSISPDLKDIISSKIDSLYEIAAYFNHYNLRTFLFFLSKCSEIANNLPDRSFIERILDYIFTECIKTKMGIHVKKEWTDYPFNFFSIFEHPYYKRALGFRFIDDYIISSRLVLEDVQKDVNAFLSLEEKRLKNENDPVNRLTSWEEMEEGQVEELLNNILKRVKENQYSIQHYLGIFELFAKLNSIGFSDHYVDQLVNLMKDNIENDDAYLIGTPLLWGGYSYHAIEYKKKYEQIRDELKDLISHKLTTLYYNYNHVNEILEDNVSWGDGILSFITEKIREERDDGYIKFPLLDHIDVDRLLTRIKESDSHNICSFIKTIDKIYYKDFKIYYKSDSPNLEKLFMGLKDEDPSYDLIKRENIKQLKDKISEISKSEWS